MSQRTGGVRRPLANPMIYSLVQRLLGAEAVRRSFLAQYARPRAGERILDLGCGPGDILDHLPSVDYVGVDMSPDYVRAAQARFGARGRFICADIESFSRDYVGEFDAVIAIGVVHHLDDAQATGMARAAARLLAPDGRFVTLDPGLTADQPAFARWLIQRDRGSSVRSPEAYGRLAAPHFSSVEVGVHHDLSHVPYTHVAVSCRDVRR